METEHQVEYKTFPIEGSLKDVSERQDAEHRALYKGYVAQYNRIEGLLADADATAANPHFSTFGELKRRETWAHNGALLHQMYFENLAGAGLTKPEPRTTELITRHHGSLSAFKSELINTGKVAPVGWAVWAFSHLDQRTHVFLIEQHMNHTPMGVIPLLVLDLFEHAYMIDHGTARLPYLEAFWENVNWSVVEKRVESAGL